MALKDALNAGPPAPRYPDKIGQWRAGLDKGTREAFDAAVRDPAWSHSILARMLTDDGFKVSDKAVRAYRDRIAREGAA